MAEHLKIKFSAFPEIQTKRLLLRQLREEDAGKIYILRSDPEQNRYIDRERAKGVEDAVNFINKINGSISRNEALYWGIALKETDELAGTICLWNISEENLCAETGYELLREYQGRGYVTEAVGALMDYGYNQMNLKMITAYVHPENQKSINVLERLGFKFTGKAEGCKEDIYERKKIISE